MGLESSYLTTALVLIVVRADLSRQNAKIRFQHDSVEELLFNIRSSGEHHRRDPLEKL